METEVDIRTSNLFFDDKNRLINEIKDISRSFSNYKELTKDIYKKENLIEIDGIQYCNWDDLSLSNGLPSLIVLYGELNKLFPEGNLNVNVFKVPQSRLYVDGTSFNICSSIS